MTLWIKEDIIKTLSPIVKESHLPDECTSITGVSINSRTLVPGELFVAIEGEVTDGHSYVAQALERGASLVIVDHLKAQKMQNVLAGRPHLMVIDTLKALELLGNEARGRSAATIIGVTGSVGKTSVRHALGFLLGAQKKTNTSQKSYNNHWGVPLSLANFEQDAAYGVFEMGMNASGEIRRLTIQVRPHVALITTIGMAHMGRLGSVEAIANAKAEIFAGLDRQNGVAVLNGDSPCFDLLLKRAHEAQVAHVVTFGRAPQWDVHLKSHAVLAEGQQIELTAFGKDYAIHLGFKGDHWVSNTLGIFAALHAAGADLSQAANDIKNLTLIEGRGMEIKIPLSSGGTVTVIDDSYNANPTSMAAGIAVLAGSEGHKIAVLGDMLELGHESKALHEAVLEHLVKAGVDQLYVCGPMMHHLHKIASASLSSYWAADAEQLSQKVVSQIKGGDTILIKGSNSMKMVRVLEAIQFMNAHGKQKEVTLC